MIGSPNCPPQLVLAELVFNTATGKYVARCAEAGTLTGDPVELRYQILAAVPQASSVIWDWKGNV
jgi:hypothetical protein